MTIIDKSAFIKPMIIGREQEIKKLRSFQAKGEARFLALYGRRRVGKTFLIRSFFEPEARESQNNYYLEITGRKDQPISFQLQSFSQSYSDTYLKGSPSATPNSWSQAFETLDKQISLLGENFRHTIFLDELPWMATKGSNLLSEIDYFWNTKWSKRKNVNLIVCGSAASWMTSNIVNAKGGLYNRLSDLIHLKPFSISEVSEYIKAQGIVFSTRELAELYMVFGGVPHYLNFLEKGHSLSENIHKLLFSDLSPLYDEYERLFESLFDSRESYYLLMERLAKSPRGVLRSDLKKDLKLSDYTLNKVLGELSSSSFISSYKPFGKKSRNSFYRIVDEFSLFYLKWVKETKGIKLSSNYWVSQQQKAGWSSWAGYGFETLVEKHYLDLLKVLGISGIQCSVHKWKYQGSSEQKTKGAEIDLVIDRADNLINCCEIKFTQEAFVVSKKLLKEQKERLAIFKQVTKSKKGLSPILISASGVLENSYVGEFADKVVTLEDLVGVGKRDGS